ncbi:MAG TPA: DUF4335 domain-containing protein [Kamptonema sp.]|nr:DUF4335 domain-containing protein [Kamptonema sp.]
MVLRRYTPPTCTLEITAKASPLSRWAGQPVLKSLRFQLRLDDPRLPEERHVTLKGDRAQLEALHEVVSTYVQDFLSQPPILDTRLKSETTSAIAEPDSALSTLSTISLDEDRNPFEKASTTTDSETHYPATNTGSLLTSHPHLKARGLLTHDLFLGQLADETSGPAIELSALQLFDLATALDEYAAEVLALPYFKRSGESQAAAPWLRSVAVVLLTVGLTTGAIKLLDRSGVKQQTASKASPAPTAIATRTYPSPIQAAPPPPVLATPPLPPPPPGGTASPSPILPQIATPIPPSPVKPNPVQPPPLLFPPSPVPAPSSSPERVVTIPGDREGSVPSDERIARAPKSAPIEQNPIPVPGAIAPPPPSGLPTVPNPSAIGTIPPGISDRNELPPLADAPSPAQSQEDKQAAAAPNSNRTLFDTIPQVTEARTYFEQHWSPPNDLKETLEYSLQLDANGSIQRIIPRGQAAGDYIDRTNMPLVGEPFVSAVPDGKTPRIRLVLRPNGKVQAFLESLQ